MTHMAEAKNVYGVHCKHGRAFIIRGLSHIRVELRRA